MAFISCDTKYSQWYFSLIDKRKIDAPEGYSEKHHIIPRCLGGSDNKENLVSLTAREHFVAHWLLTKMFPNEIWKTRKMIRAFVAMSVWINTENQERDSYVNSRVFERLRIKFAECMSLSQSGELNNGFGSFWIHNRELKRNERIPKDSTIPCGWEKGRVLNWDKEAPPIRKPKKVCLNCNQEFQSTTSLQKFCSEACRNQSYFQNCNPSVKVEKDGKIKLIKIHAKAQYLMHGWKEV